ncbi:MAG TPA: DUF3500 domain-containing protein [Bryobacteraceae bacterium]|nr:DUF3500 domain-containing protein [Bryobacteraceae bacterium]
MGVILPASPHHHDHPESVLTEAARRFLAALDPKQHARATFPFDDQERYNWTYLPGERQGLPLLDMSPHQRHLASGLLSAGLSQSGYIKAVTIMSLEEVLRVLENDSGVRRNPEKYYISIFGTPSDDGVWGYRFEGHHISQNYTVAGGEVVDAPAFFGANPAEVRQGPLRGLRALAAEEDLGRELLSVLDGDQRSVAIVDPVAYRDILTAANRQAALQGQASGLCATAMKARQWERLIDLLREFTSNLPDAMAETRHRQIAQAGRQIHFAWAGGTQRGEPHYYRIQTSAFLIEYDNTQNDANHVHTVWRDFTGDFGHDLLAAHYRSGHHHK